MNRRERLFSVGTLFSLGLFGLQANANPISFNQRVTQEIVFKGACDGSAAVNIGADTLLVANDENNFLASYSHIGGTPIAQRSLNDLLGFTEDDEVREIDIEAAAMHDNQIWWIGSHGRNKNGKLRPLRRSLFATNIPRPDLGDLEITSPRVDLLPVLISSEMTSRFFTPHALEEEPKNGGVNIEAMTFDKEDNLVLGFRAPLSGADGMTGDALLVRLSPTPTGFQVSQVHELHLNDRGFRDIIAFDRSFLIIAGSVSDTEPTSIYLWDGENDPIEAIVDGMNDFNAEALVVMDEQLFVISDDGSFERQYGEQASAMEECKDILDQSGPENTHSNVFSRARTFSLE